MIDHEQELVHHQARLRRERVAVLRRRRAIAELWRQIAFDTMWANPRRRAIYDGQRRVFYQARPDLYEPLPKTIGRRALLASLGTLLAEPVLAQAADPLRPKILHRAERLPAAFGDKTSGETGSRIDVRDFSTVAHPFRSGSDDAVPIQAAIDQAAAIGGATVYRGLDR